MVKEIKDSLKIFLNLMYDNDVEEAKKIYDTYGEYFAQLEENNPDRKNLSEILYSMVGDIRGKKILDAGCGVGNDCKMLSENGAKVVGIDISQKMIDLAKERCRDYDVEFYLNDMERTEFPDSEFDIAISAFSILYKENLKGIVREFRRVLKKDGELYIIVPHPIRKMMKYTRNYFDTGKHWESFGKMKFFNYYRTAEEYVNTLVSQGFVIKEIREPKPVKSSENFFPCYLIIKSVNS